MIKADDYYFYVQFTDKYNTPYSIDEPEEYLSQQALDRRAAFQIAIDSTDLPVNPSYVDGISEYGIHIHARSKWLNGVTVLVSDSSLMAQVRSLPYVEATQYTGRKFTEIPSSRIKSNNLSAEMDYGSATAQINQLNGQTLHEHGCTGRGMTIGLLDAGFKDVHTNPAFDSLRLQNRLLGVQNFVDPAMNVYTSDTHGSHVLSIMAANLPGVFVGVAPHAAYWLIQTEFVPTEYLVEVDFWVAGIEFADSAGVDIINSSLGYSEFDDTTMNFRYADMNGWVSRASIAANMAAQKGMIVCNSAGNEGNKPWKYITSPADAEHVLTVGAVTASGTPSIFSSYGPTADGRTKPDVCATGTATALVNTTGNPDTGNGTSYSSPIVAGLTACYWEFLKKKIGSFTPQTIRASIIASAHLINTPDNQAGYGLPDFASAINNVLANNTVETPQAKSRWVIFDHVNRAIRLSPEAQQRDNQASLYIYNFSGKLVGQTNKVNSHAAINLQGFSPGFYLLTIWLNQKPYTFKLMIP